MKKYFFRCSVCILLMIPGRGSFEEFFSDDNETRILIERTKIATPRKVLNTILNNTILMYHELSNSFGGKRKVSHVPRPLTGIVDSPLNVLCGYYSR